MTGRRLRIAFMGTPAFTVPVLERLLAGPHEVVCVYTRAPQPSGRGYKTLAPTPVHAFATDKGLPVRTPASLKKDAEARAAFLSLNLDAAVVAGYGMMLPREVLEGPRFGCLNVHPSLLPRWRGTSPVQHAIWKGDAQTGVAVIRLVETMDAGPVYKMKTVPVGAQDTTAALDKALWPLGAEILAEALDRLAAGEELFWTAQDEAQATYAPLLSREDGRIDWTRAAAEIDRQIRALNPWPGVWTVAAGGKRLKIPQAAPADESADGPPGTVAGRGGLVACGGGTTLRLARVQPENAREMDAGAAINGGYLTPGEILGAG